jgi:putative acetyltransferase
LVSRTIRIRKENIVSSQRKPLTAGDPGDRRVEIAVRPEKPEDVPAIQVVNERAFGRREEGDIVDRLRESCPDFVSLLAEATNGDGTLDGSVVGALLFTPAGIEAPGRRIDGMLLGPLAVLPERQRQGVGSALMRRGLELLRGRGCPFVVLVGHPEYYPRFGFERASAHGLVCPWDGVPDEAWMVCILDAGAMAGASGVVRVREEWGAAV